MAAVSSGDRLYLCDSSCSSFVEDDMIMKAGASVGHQTANWASQC